MICHRARTLVISLAAVVIGSLASARALAQCSGWNQVQAVGPSIRSSHAMAFDTIRGKTILFGGYGPKPDGSEYLSDLWEFDGATWALRTTSGPAARQNAAMVFDSARAKTVLFGGLAYTTGPITFGQTWEWNGSAWANVATTGPSPRYLHAMAYDAARQNTVLFGGLADGIARDTFTWTWNGSAWFQAAATGPSARFGHAMAYDAVRQRVVLFGGFGGSGDVKVLLQDTWEWDGTSWALVASTGPISRQFHTMAYDAVRQRVVLLGGRDENGATIDDQWEWNGSSWSQVTGAGPSGRESSAMTFDPSHQRLVVSGGFSERGRLGDTWERLQGTGSLPVFVSSPDSRFVIPGSTVVLMAQATGSGPLTYQWLRDGSAVVDGARISGASTPSLAIAGADIFDAGNYALRVTNACGSVTSSAALIDVHCPADVENGTMTGTRDGAVEVSDLIAFLGFFERGDIRADIDDGSGTGVVDRGVDVNDILFFLARFEIGC